LGLGVVPQPFFVKFMKYFMSQNAGQPVFGLKFEVCEIVGGTAFGVFATEDSRTIDSLTSLIKKTSIRSITEAEYLDYLKKKPRALIDSKQSNPPLPTRLPGVAIKGPGAVVVVPEPREAEVRLPVASVENVDDALVVKPVEVVKPVPPAPVVEQKIRRAK
jgi:hypothetical protein